MGEFKGTKTNWILKVGDKETFTKIIIGKNKVLKFEYKTKEWQSEIYDALIISKAPEMLEMLKKFVKVVEDEEIIITENFDNDGYENCGNRLYNEFKQLIKEATQL